MRGPRIVVGGVFEEAMVEIGLAAVDYADDLPFSMQADIPDRCLVIVAGLQRAGRGGIVIDDLANFLDPSKDIDAGDRGKLISRGENEPHSRDTARVLAVI